MGAMASQIISLTIVYSTVYSGPDHKNYQSSASLAFVRGIHRWPVNSPHKGPVTQKRFSLDDVIMHAKKREQYLESKHLNNIRRKTDIALRHNISEIIYDTTKWLLYRTANRLFDVFLVMSQTIAQCNIGLSGYNASKRKVTFKRLTIEIFDSDIHNRSRRKLICASL